MPSTLLLSSSPKRRCSRRGFRSGRGGLGVGCSTKTWQVATLVVALLWGFATPQAQASSPLRSALDEERTKQSLPGVVAVVVVKDAIVFEGGSGFADIETRRAMTKDTVVFPGSLSKLFTAVAVLQEVDAGRVNLDIPVVRWMPDLGNRAEQRRITPRHLLAHTSGLPSEANFSYWFTGQFPHRDAVVSAAANAWLTTVPIKSSSYSNLGYAVLGHLVEKTTSVPFQVHVERAVLSPLGMAKSGVGCPSVNVARGYSPMDALLPTRLAPFAGVGKKVGRRHIREYCGANAMTPAFGLFTTAHDMGAFVSLLLGTRNSKPKVLTRASLEKMGTRQQGGRTLGLRGMRVDGVRLLRHDGWFAAHKSHILLDRENQIGVYVTANADDAKPDKIAKRLWRTARQLSKKNALKAPKAVGPLKR